jgi:hypothetical protein
VNILASLPPIAQVTTPTLGAPVKVGVGLVNDLKDAIKNNTLSGKLSSAMSAFQRGVSVATGKTSIKGNVDNVFSSLVDRPL